VALAAVLGAEEAVADGVHPLQAVAALDELLELERQPLAAGRVGGHPAGAHRRPRHVHPALLARERRHLLRRLDQEVAASARLPRHRHRAPPVLAPQVHLRACRPAGMHVYACRHACIYGQNVGQHACISFAILHYSSSRALFSFQKILQIFSDSPSHRIFRRMHEVLNIDENKN